jgi:hypothetical protein
MSVARCSHSRADLEFSTDWLGRLVERCLACERKARAEALRQKLDRLAVRREQDRRRRAANRERLREYNRRRRAAHPERARQAKQRFLERNPDYARQWRQRQKERGVVRQILPEQREAANGLDLEAWKAEAL